jgi:alpha-tubulin suppressor-like RCC1 family protein
LLTENGHLYTLGCAEQGRLGRIGELFASRGGRRGLALLLTPEEVHAKNRHVAFADVWSGEPPSSSTVTFCDFGVLKTRAISGSMSTVALTTDNEVLVCGLNNYNQLGITNRLVVYTMTISPAFTKIAQEHGENMNSLPECLGHPKQDLTVLLHPPNNGKLFFQD